jgi:hypothetical protein
MRQPPHLPFAQIDLRRGRPVYLQSSFPSFRLITRHLTRSGVTTPHPQPKDRRMRKAAEPPCKQRAFRDPPRTPAGPLPDPFPSNTPATRAAPATTNLQERLENPSGKRLGPFRDCTVGPGSPSPPVNAVGASAGRRAGPPALAEALPSRLGGRRSDESEGKGFGKGASTIAWFTSFSGETVQPMLKPLFQPLGQSGNMTLSLIDSF